MVIQRGEIWWAELPEPAGSEPAFSRPVLVVSSDDFNASNISTVLVAAITSNVHHAKYPGNVLLTRRDSGLPKKSVINVSQVVTLDKSRFAERVKKVSRRQMEKVESGLKLVLCLD